MSRVEENIIRLYLFIGEIIENIGNPEYKKEISKTLSKISNKLINDYTKKLSFKERIAFKFFYEMPIKFLLEKGYQLLLGYLEENNYLWKSLKDIISPKGENGSNNKIL